MSDVRKDVGVVTAYGYAVEGGYQGTEAQYTELMGSIANIAQEATDAKTAAETAQGKAEDAQEAAETAQGKAEDAQEAAERAQGLADDAKSAANDSATSASESALKAEGFAVGEQNGVEVGSDSPYYHNNAKYYSEEAGDSATQAAASAATSAAMTGLAPQFDSTKAYSAGDYVLYSGTLYQFTSAHAAGAWTGTDAVATVMSNGVTDLKSQIGGLYVPLTLVATYTGKLLRKTGLEDNSSFITYQYAIPEECSLVHIKSNFYGNTFIIFTDRATDGDFSASQYQAYPSSGYSNPTTVDDDYDSKGFKYVWFPLYTTSGVTASASASYKNIVDAVVQNAVLSEAINDSLLDLNQAEPNRIYVFTANIANVQNYPPIPNGGTLLCYSAYGVDKVQLFISSQNAVYFRRLWGTTWGAWKQIQTEDTVQSIVETAVSTAIADYYPYNILSAFKNITCIGDSLTASQVYTSATTSRQAYKPYPKVIADRAGATETILAMAGDSASQAWNRNGENIVQKDAQLTLVYLGTNGGLTDTMDTDMVGNDYTQWANTNTGCYGKIIAKSIAVGSRVVLIKVHSSSGGVAVTNTVIEKMATRFGVPFIENIYLSGVKYHSFPDGSGTEGTHYNDFGYSVFADQVANSISHLSPTDAVKIIPA